MAEGFRGLYDNLLRHIRDVADDAAADPIDGHLPPADRLSSPEDTPAVTADLVARLKSAAPGDMARWALTANTHGIPDSVFTDDRERYLSASDVPSWLAEPDPVEKRYLYCHCPLARESLKNRGGGIDPDWCHCSAGFVKRRFDVAFGEETRAEVVESVMSGDDCCTFAVSLPSGKPAGN